MEFRFGVSWKRKQNSILECLRNGNGIPFQSVSETKMDFYFLMFFMRTYSRTMVES